MLCYIVYLRSAASAARQPGRQDVQDEIYDRVADKVSAVRSVFKELCAGERDAWQTLAQHKKVATARDEKLGQVKVNPGVGMLQCCQVFALHCSFPHTVSPSPFTFSTVSQFSHTKVQCEHLNPKTQKPKTKTQTRTRSCTRNRKSEVLHSICEQAANHQSPSPARTGKGDSASTDCSCRAAAAK